MNSVIFYPCFLFICSLFTYFGNKYKNYSKNYLIWITICLFVFILGIRENFGTDQPVYLHMYYYQGADLQRCEKIFVWLNSWLRNSNAPYQILFSCIAFLQIIFIVLFFEEENTDIFFGFIFFYLIYIFGYVNIARQCVAMSIVLLSYSEFAKKRYFIWVFLVLLAFGFHISAIISLLIIPIIAFLRRLRIPNCFFYMLLIFVMIFYNYMFDFIIKKILLPINLAFGGNSILELVLTHKIKLGSGMGVRLRIFAYIIMLPKMLEYKSYSEKNNFFFCIFYIGILGEFVASVNMNLQRIFFYYSLIQVKILPDILCCINKKSVKQLKLSSVLFLSGVGIIIFLAFINAIKGINNTEFYYWNLDFNLFDNHIFR